VPSAVRYIFTDVSEEHTASIFRVKEKAKQTTARSKEMEAVYVCSSELLAIQSQEITLPELTARHSNRATAFILITDSIPQNGPFLLRKESLSAPHPPSISQLSDFGRIDIRLHT
jgi:hypothetical protein